MNKAQNMIFNIIQKRDPQIAQALQQCINQGESPKQVLGQLIEAGKVSRNDIAQIRNNLGMINRFTGLRISNNDLNELDKMFDNQNTNQFRF